MTASLLSSATSEAEVEACTLACLWKAAETRQIFAVATEKNKTGHQPENTSVSWCMSACWSTSALHIITAAPRDVCVGVCVRMCVQACAGSCLEACDCSTVPLPATVPQLILGRPAARVPPLLCKAHANLCAVWACVNGKQQTQCVWGKGLLPATLDCCFSIIACKTGDRRSMSSVWSAGFHSVVSMLSTVII